MEVLFSSFCALILSLTIVAFHLAEASVPAVFIFGDSTMDVGTNNYLPNSTSKANFLYNGIDFPLSQPTGRFSNSYNTADEIAKQLGFKQSPHCFFHLVKNNSTFKQNILKGVNFASGGSGILDTTGFELAKQVVPLTEQIQQFSTVRDNITETLGAETAAFMLSKSFFVISAGSNDVFEYQKNISVGTNITTLEFLSTLESTYQNHLQNLYDLGARKYGIIGIPPLGCCPFERTFSNTSDCFEEVNELAQAISASIGILLQNFSSAAQGMNYSLGNAYDITFDIINSPGSVGMTEVKAACCGNGAYPCNKTADLCPHRNKYLFWDGFHPTHATSRLAALALFRGEPRYVQPITFGQLMNI